jgi:GNAT superfamily N-acetyltransferase
MTMPEIRVRRCTVAELEAAPNLAELLAEYAAESSLPELGPACAQVETYRVMEASGFFHPIGAFDGERLVGFILPIVITLPHYGVLAATVESFFVPKAERSKGVGLRLLKHAEDLATGLGAKALIVSAPAFGALSSMLARKKSYRLSNEAFVRAL